jgi:hypothetical protein
VLLLNSAREEARVGAVLACDRRVDVLRDVGGAHEFAQEPEEGTYSAVKAEGISRHLVAQVQLFWHDDTTVVRWRRQATATGLVDDPVQGAPMDTNFQSWGAPFEAKPWQWNT